MIIDERISRARIEVMENGIDPGVFMPRDQAKCRQTLGLPLDGRIIGTIGALQRNRGISALIGAYEQLVENAGGVCLAVAGPRDRGFRVPAKGKFFDLGNLTQERAALLLSALDVAIVANLDSEFGRYCFPAKFYEIVAAGVPIAAASVGAIQELLSDYPDTLFEPGDASDLAQVILQQLVAPTHIDIQVPTWADIARKLLRLMSDICEAR
jgi:glycosyltransferase involved in cell wall biosynthesis